jgi:predicted RNase H-like HicB family nuclease/DNA-binding XRE family transcriptional regulator
MIRYQARIYRDGDEYSVEFPDLPGCFSRGLSKDHARANACEALSLYLEEARDPEWRVPTPKQRRGRSFEWVAPDVSVAIPLMIRQARRRGEFSQRQLAREAGMTVQQLQKLETPGKSNPTVATLMAISQALNQTLDIRIDAPGDLYP